MSISNYCIIISGPTGVGKTAAANDIAHLLPVEIINGDMGQCYAPLTIGTAKPAWQTSPIVHHMFDIVSTPTLFSAMNFRRKVAALLPAIRQREHLPLIVGGSSYYIGALFFPPATHGKTIVQHAYDPTINWWERLRAIDPERAAAIDPHDTYRIRRALDIWHSTGERPSSYKPIYDPVAPSVLIWLTRDRAELYARIDERVVAMVAAGWVEEVRALIGTSWEQFLLTKKFIGYPEVIAYCHGQMTKDTMITTIQTKSRNYAKRQMTFWRMLSHNIKQGASRGTSRVIVHEVNLTHEPLDRYIKHLITMQ